MPRKHKNAQPRVVPKRLALGRGKTKPAAPRKHGVPRQGTVLPSGKTGQYGKNDTVLPADWARRQSQVAWSVGAR